MTRRSQAEASPGAAQPPRLERYRIEDEVGAGGMSVVYAARDLELDRPVALKVMRPNQGHGRDEDQLREEARAIAGLVHPNIVPVYDVGRADDGRLYMSMELVRGHSLRAWLDAKPRTCQQVLDVFVAAGRGLSAAHAVDLVHCDFKPSNVLVGDDGRVRVVDFGIARRVLLSETVTAQSLARSPDTRGPSRRQQEVIGTPQYMSPEQVRGQALDAKSDQFSFCVALYEALYGQRPFLGTTTRERLRNILSGELRRPPRGTLVPKRIHAALVRGLQPAPEARWPSMNVLLRVLTRGRSGSRRWMFSAAVAGIGCLGAALAWIPARSPCASAGEEVEAIWTEARRDRIRDAMLDAGLPDARGEQARIERDLSAFADAWATSRRAVCEAQDAAGERAAQLRCLRRALSEFDVLLEVLGTADISTLRDANVAIAALPDVSRCTQDDPSPPDDIPEHLEDRVAELEEELSTAPMLVELHRYRRADALTTSIVHEARQLGHRPLLAKALYRRGDVLAGQGRQNEAAETFEEAFHAAQTARMDRLAAEIAIDLQLTYGYRLAKPKLAARWSGLAQGAVERLGEDAGALRAEYIRTEGLIALRSSEYPRAREHFEAAVATYEALDGDDPLPKAEALSNLGIATLNLGLLEQSQQAFLRALELTEPEVGPFNTRLITIINNLGSLAQTRGDHEASLAYFQRVYEAELALFGPVDVRVAMSLNNVGSAMSALRRDEQAIEYYRRSIRAYESGDHHGVDLARPVGNLAVARMRAGELEAAEAGLLRAIQLIEAEAGPTHAELGIHWFNLASVRMEMGKLDQAREAMLRCNEIDEAVLGHDHPNVAQNLAAIASIHIRNGEPDRARPLLGEALQIYGRFEVDPVVVAVTQFELGKLLWQDDQDRARALVDRAEQAFSSAGVTAEPQLEDVRAWKREH